MPKMNALDQAEGRGEAAEALLRMRADIEECISDAGLDLHDEVKAAIIKCLDRHIEPSQHTKRGPGPAWHERQEGELAQDRAVARRGVDDFGAGRIRTEVFG